MYVKITKIYPDPELTIVSENGIDEEILDRLIGRQVEVRKHAAFHLNLAVTVSPANAGSICQEGGEIKNVAGRKRPWEHITGPTG